MLYFVVFIIVHVTLVMATGALRNLNHMYAMRNDTSWVGFGIFAASLVVIVVAWIAARPLSRHRGRQRRNGSWFTVREARVYREYRPG